MPYCRDCGAEFQWGFCGDRWVLLELKDRDRDLDKSFVDENGIPRADHRDRHRGEPAINVQRLGTRIPAESEVELTVGEAQDQLHSESPLGRFFPRIRN